MERILKRIEQRYPVNLAQEADISQIHTVFDAVWPARKTQERFHRRFRHRYFDNPYSKGIESILAARDGDRIIGFTGTMDFELWYHDRMLPATCSIDQAVLPAYQALGIGYLLLKPIYTRNVIPVAGDLNRPAQILHQKMGVREISSCYVLRRWTQLNDALRDWKDPVFTVETRSQADERFDLLWLAARQSYPIIGVRNRAIVKWRYENNPLRHFTIYTLCANDHLVGYVVTTMEHLKGVARKGILVDFLFAPLTRDTIASFLLYVLGHLARQGAVCVDVLASHLMTLEILKTLGFFSKNFNPHFVVYTNDLTASKTDLWNGHSWHLTFGDSDFIIT